MRAHCSVFIACSIDGFIARRDGAIDWLEDANRDVPAGEDCGYKNFMLRTDVIVMGRHTFEKVMSFDAWPYTEMPVVVLSQSLARLPAATPPNVTLWHGELEELVRSLSVSGKRRIYVDGGQTIQSFLRARLIDEITVTTIPVLLGGGIPLFGELGLTVAVRLDRSQAFEKTSAQLLRARDTSSKIREKSSRTYVRSGVFPNFFLV
jgi:dihydrofolate reductase